MGNFCPAAAVHPRGFTVKFTVHGTVTGLVNFRLAHTVAASCAACSASASSAAGADAALPSPPAGAAGPPLPLAAAVLLPAGAAAFAPPLAAAVAALSRPPAPAAPGSGSRAITAPKLKTCEGERQRKDGLCQQHLHSAIACFPAAIPGQAPALVVITAICPHLFAQAEAVVDRSVGVQVGKDHVLLKDGHWVVGVDACGQAKGRG